MRIAWLGFLLPLTLPPIAVAGHALGGAWSFLPLLVLFVVLPVVDHLGGDERRPVAPRGTTPAAARLWFDGLLYAWVPVQLALLAWGASVVAAGPDPLVALGVTLSVGAITGGIGITVAHELGHRLGRVPRAASCTLLATVAYAHFHIEHNKGHHARVATPEDPASARHGESFYAFLPRTLVGGLASAWDIERRRLAREGRAALDPANRVLWCLAAPLVLGAAAYAGLGAAALAFFALQAAIAVVLLELVNYVEHYGLRRARGRDGRWERVRHAHSWNSSSRVGNWYLYNLQRHSHHHANVARRYEELEHVDDAPQLPAGSAPVVAVVYRCGNVALGALRSGNIEVPAGQVCVLQGTRVDGNIQLGAGSVLDARDVTVIGNVQADGAAAVLLAGNSAITGSVQIKQGEDDDTGDAGRHRDRDRLRQAHARRGAQQEAGQSRLAAGVEGLHHREQDDAAGVGHGDGGGGVLAVDEERLDGDGVGAEAAEEVGEVAFELDEAGGEEKDSRRHKAPRQSWPARESDEQRGPRLCDAGDVHPAERGCSAGFRQDDACCDRRQDRPSHIHAVGPGSAARRRAPSGTPLR